jgi:hypothetical protein
MSTVIQVDAPADETEVFRANENLHTAGASTRTVAQPNMVTKMCTYVTNSPVVRSLMLLVVIGLLLFLIERLSGGASSSDTKAVMAEVLRSVLKANMQPAVAMLALDERNATNTTLAQ